MMFRNAVEEIEEIYQKELPSLYPSIFLARSASLIGRGIDWLPEKAELKARMEFLERRSLFHPLISPIYWGSALDFLEGVCGVSEDDDQLRWWIPMHCSEDDKEYVFPLEYTQIESACSINNPVVRRDSTGFAAHDDEKKAILFAYNEYMERAGLHRLWNQKILYTINANGAAASIDKLYRIFDDNKYKVILMLDVAECGFLTTVCMLYRLESNFHGPALVLGSGGAQHIGDSIEKSMLEAFAQLVNAIELNDVGINEDNFSYYFNKENAERLIREWIEDAPEVDIDDCHLPKKHTKRKFYYMFRVHKNMNQDNYKICQVLIPGLKILDKKGQGYACMPCPFV